MTHFDHLTSLPDDPAGSSSRLIIDLSRERDEQWRMPEFTMSNESLKYRSGAIDSWRRTDDQMELRSSALEVEAAASEEAGTMVRKADQSRPMNGDVAQLLQDFGEQLENRPVDVEECAGRRFNLQTVDDQDHSPRAPWPAELGGVREPAGHPQGI